jgi:hypothetical protein
VIKIFDELISFWKLIKQAEISGDIKRGMYFYLSGCLVIVGGLYLWLLWSGFTGITAIFNVWLLGRKSDIPFTVINGAGIIMLIRYSIMGAIDGLKQKPPANLESRLKGVEKKMDRLYKMAVEPDYDPKKDELESVS